MNFILSLENSLTKENCENIIKCFEEHSELWTSGQTSLGNDSNWKKSTDIHINPDFMKESDWEECLTPMFISLEKGLFEYKEKYTKNDNNVLCGINGIQNWGLENTFNIQRYLPGEGYYVWHCEAPGLDYCHRVLVWMFYLNDVLDGGGTEFKLQQYTSDAKQGKLLLWPSYWTHYHRGIVSNTETKYIITGWFGLY